MIKKRSTNHLILKTNECLWKCVLNPSQPNKCFVLLVSFWWDLIKLLRLYPELVRFWKIHMYAPIFQTSFLGIFSLFLDRLLTPVSPGQISLKNYPGTEATPKGSTHPLSIHKRPPQRETPTMRTTMLQSIPKKDLPKERPPTKGTTMLQSIPKRTSAKRDPHKGDYHASKHPRKDHLKERPPQRGLPYHKSSQKEPL